MYLDTNFSMIWFVVNIKKVILHIIEITEKYLQKRRQSEGGAFAYVIDSGGVQTYRGKV